MTPLIRAESPTSRDQRRTPPPGGRCDTCGGQVSRWNAYRTRCYGCVTRLGPPDPAAQRRDGAR